MGGILRAAVLASLRHQSRFLDGLRRFTSLVPRRWDGFRVLINLNKYKGGPRGGLSAQNYVEILENFVWPQVKEHFHKLSEGKPQSEFLKPLLVKTIANCTLQRL